MGATCAKTCCSDDVEGRIQFPATTDENFTSHKATMPGMPIPETDNNISAPDPSRTTQASWDETNTHPNDAGMSGAVLPPPPKPSDDPAQAAAEKAQTEKDAREAKDAKEARERRAREKKEKEAREKSEKEKQAKEKVALAKAKKEAEEREKAKKEEEQKRLEENAGPLGKPGARLEICLEEGWKPLGDDEFQQIKNHMQGGSKKFAIQARGTMYVVDFTDMNNPTQANAATRKSRKLRVILP